MLEAQDGRLYRGTREIFAHLRERDPGRFAAAHRRRFADHRSAAGLPTTLVSSSRTPVPPGHLEQATRLRNLVHASAVERLPEVGDNWPPLDGRRIGLLAYRRSEGRIAFTHTEIAASCGSGAASEAGLPKSRSRTPGGTASRVVPLCPFIARYIDRHPEYAPLVATVA